MTLSRKTVIAAVSALAVFVTGVAAMPRPLQLSDRATGDPELVAEVRAHIAATPGARDKLSVAVIDGDSLRVAHFGASDTTEYEIGSVTKTITAALLADAIERGEVEASTRLGSLFALGNRASSAITLEELATQSSGLPRVAMSLDKVPSILMAIVLARDPYGSTLDELIEDARDVRVGDKTYGYSNLGFALLGQALATRSGTAFPTLARERIFQPLGMVDSYVPMSVGDLRDDAPTGYSASGRPNDAWTLGADAPAGSARSTLRDMTVYTRAHLDGTAPGVAATEPRRPAGTQSRIGYGWHITDDITWHNGMTGGFASWIGFDRGSDRAVVILSNTANSVDSLGFGLMGAE